MLIALLVIVSVLLFLVMAMYGAVDQIRDHLAALKDQNLRLYTTQQLMAVSWKRLVDRSLALDPAIWGDLLRTEFRDAPDGIKGDPNDN